MARDTGQKASKNSKSKKAVASASSSRRVARPTSKSRESSKTRKAAAHNAAKAGAAKAAGTSVRAAAKRTIKAATKVGVTRNRRSTEREPVSEPADSAALAAARAPAARADRFLTPQEVAQFRQMLLQKRVEILSDVSTLRNEALAKDRRDAAGDLSSMPIHMADLGTDNYELEFTLGLIEGEGAILKEIDEALDRVHRGTYGICLATGKPIGKARLRAKPWAKYCYEYTLAQEKGQGRRF